jgi:hypothetical protein
MREYLPVILIGLLAVPGLLLMLAAFLIIAIKGGWNKAMQSDSEGRWPRARKLMLAGASLAFLSAVAMLVYQAMGGFRSP